MTKAQKKVGGTKKIVLDIVLFAIVVMQSSWCPSS